jgi:hypothetical protein
MRRLHVDLCHPFYIAVKSLTAAIDSIVGRQHTESALPGPKSAASNFFVLACSSSQQVSLSRNKIYNLCRRQNKVSPWTGPVFYSRKNLGSNFIGLRAVLRRRHVNNISEKHAQLTLYYVQEEGPARMTYLARVSRMTFIRRFLPLALSNLARSRGGRGNDEATFLKDSRKDSHVGLQGAWFITTEDRSRRMSKRRIINLGAEVHLSAPHVRLVTCNLRLSRSITWSRSRGMWTLVAGSQDAAHTDASWGTRCPGAGRCQ